MVYDKVSISLAFVLAVTCVAMGVLDIQAHKSWLLIIIDFVFAGVFLSEVIYRIRHRPKKE